MENIIYKLADGRLWDVQGAAWLPEAGRAAYSGEEVITLVSAEGRSDESYLAETLAFYGYPLGELIMLSPQGIRDRLNQLDAEYLTPRVLAGLATGDEYARQRWQEHEAQAAPLRERLGQA